MSAWIFYSLWQIWKARNDYCFNGVHPNPMQVMYQTKALCLEYISATAKPTAQPNRDHIINNNEAVCSKIWKPPPALHIKVNTDAKYDANTGKGFIGIIARDEQGNLQTMLAKRIFAKSPLMAEAIGLREAMSLAYSLNITKAIFESDSQALIEACKGKIRIGEISAISADIEYLSKFFENLVFTWTKREGNRVAHIIADLASKDRLQGDWYRDPPDELRKTIVSDCMKLWV